MEIIEIDITKEISGELYYRLIDFTVGKFPFFVFILSLTRKVNDSAKEVIEELSPFLVKRFYSKEWPGTELYSGQVEVFHFNLTETSAAILKKHTTSLYQWKLPGLPEDLSIMRNAEQPWLCNVAHDDFSMFYVTPEEKAELLKAIPELGDYLGEEWEPRAYYV